MHGMLEHDVTAALNEWGARHRDDPYDLFTAVRQRGPVQPVTLVDGHDAWLVVHHDEARAALNLSSLSKDMHAAMAGDAAVVSEASGLVRRNMYTEITTHPGRFTPDGLERRHAAAPSSHGARSSIVDDLIDEIATLA